jgi:hypothetical protein
LLLNAISKLIFGSQGVGLKKGEKTINFAMKIALYFGDFKCHFRPKTQTKISDITGKFTQPLFHKLSRKDWQGKFVSCYRFRSR